MGRWGRGLAAWAVGLALPGCIWDQAAYEARKAVLTDNDADGFTELQGDCDDAVARVFPGAAETCDGVDEDCDGAADEDPVDAVSWYADVDGDGLGGAALSGCRAPDGAVTVGGDCDDDNVAIPGTETPYDGIDQDCDGGDLVDVDGDGYAGGSGGDDCDDGDGGVNPGVGETWENGATDNDCDGEVEEIRLEYGYDVWTGATAGSQLGRRIGWVWDPGTPERALLVASAPYDTTAYTNGGAVYMIGEGKPHGVSGEAEFLAGGPDWFMVVESREFSDLNDDGRDDLLIAAPGMDSGSGHVWMVPASFDARGVVPSEVATAEILPSEDGTFFGSGASGIGDFTGDGIEDFAVGSPLASPEGVDAAGRVYVFSGDVGTTTSADAAEFVVSTTDAGAHLGNLAQAAGDQNDDGYSDLMLGADVTVVVTILPGGRRHADLTSDWIFHLIAYDDEVQKAARMIGDVDGDGKKDLGFIDTYVRIFTALALAPTRTPTDRSAEIDMGEMTYFYDLADLGDLDGDGRSETLVPAQYYDPVRSSWASIFFGSDLVFASEYDLEDAPLAALCIRPNAAFGYRVAVSPDVDGDAVGEIVLAGYSDDEAGLDAGGVAMLPIPR